MGFSPPSFFVPQNTEIGRKTFFWYRIYCAVLVFLYLFLIVFGIFLAVNQPQTREYSSEETALMGIIYAVMGVIFFLVFAVALFLPPKPYNWVVGIVMIALGMTSCCFLPFTIPLLIYWVKPETKAFFGRK
jgi:glucose uptake protein GlcU